jgi:hypothetical protein
VVFLLNFVPASHGNPCGWFLFQEEEMNETLITKETHSNMWRTHPFWMQLYALFIGKYHEHPSANWRGTFASMVGIASGFDTKIASELAQISARRTLR